MSRIGIFGGSFDPVHNTHLALAAAATQHLRLDQLRWVPTGHPWHKTSKPADAAHRVAMLKLALAGEPRYTIDELELHRSGPSYTIDTVRWLQASQPALPGQTNEWFLVIGQDQYEKFHTWHGWRELLERLTLAVANRAGAVPQAPAALQAVPHQIEVVPLPPSDTAATDIRSRLAQGLPIDMLVPPQVARYIAQNALYRK